MGPRSPVQTDNFRGKDIPGMPDDTIVSCAKKAEQIEMSFRLWTRLGRRKRLLHGVHIGAVWQIRLNCPCSSGPNEAAANGCGLTWNYSGHLLLFGMDDD